MTAEQESSEQKIKRATELIWKIWWFCWLLVVAPILAGIVFYFIFQAIIATYFTNIQYIIDVYPIAFSILVSVFSLLFFYKAFDKYRNNPFFKNKQNNLRARIHILFLVSIAALLITPIFILSTPEEYAFELLPLISFSALYNIIWYYYYSQPIDIFHIRELEFKNIKSIKISVFRPHNFIILVNFIAQILFLFFISYTGWAWFFGILINSFYYIIMIISTQQLRKEIKREIARDKLVTIELGQFQKKFTFLVYNLLFTFILFIPIIYLFSPPIGGLKFVSEYHSRLFFLISVSFLIYIKIRTYISLFYEPYINYLRKVVGEGDNEKKEESQKNRFQRNNFKSSLMLIAVCLLFSFILTNQFISIIIIPCIFFLSLFEKRKGYLSIQGFQIIQIFNSIAVLVSVCFGIISIFLPWNGQLFIFLICIYFLLQIFVKMDYIQKENALIYQNIVAILSFYLLIYFFYPWIFLQYVTFTKDPLLVFISDIMINGLLISIVILISLYRLYSRFFKEKFNLAFKITIVINLVIIQALSFCLILLRSYFIADKSTFFNILILSLNIFPLLLIFFLWINKTLNIIPQESFQHYSYLNYLIFVIIFFSSLHYFNINLTFLNQGGILLFIPIELLLNILLSICLYFLINYAYKIKKVTDEAYKKYIAAISWFFTLNVFILLFTISSLFKMELLISLLISLTITVTLLNSFSKESISSIFNAITLFYYAFTIAYYTFQISGNIVNLLLTSIVLMLLFSSVFLLIPLYYVWKKNIGRDVSRLLIKLVLILLGVLISLLPLTFGLELVFLALIENYIIFTFNIINLTLLIQWILFSLVYLRFKTKNKQKKLQKLFLKIIIFIELGFTFTFAFYYPLYFLLQTSYLVVPIITATVFFYLPSVYAYKNDIFSKTLLKRAIIVNTIILWVSILFVPINIGLDLVRLGNRINILFMATLVVILFYTFLRFASFTGEKLNLKNENLIRLKIGQIIVWFSIDLLLFLNLFSLLISIEIEWFPLGISSFFSVFILLNIPNLYQIRQLMVSLYQKEDLTKKFKKVRKMLFSLKQFIVFGLSITSTLVITFLFNPILLVSYNTLDLLYYFWIGAISSAIYLLIVLFLEKFIKTLNISILKRLKLFSWILFQLSVAVMISIYLPFSLFNKIMLFMLIFSLFMPVTLYLLEDFNVFPLRLKNFLRFISIIISLISFTGLYIEQFLRFTLNTSYFTQYVAVWGTLLSLRLILFVSFFLRMYNHKLIIPDKPKLISFYIQVLAIFFLFLYINPIANIILYGISSLIILKYRGRNIIQRILIYIVLSAILFIEINSLLTLFSAVQELRIFSLEFYMLIYIASLLGVLFLSIISNYSHINFPEKFSLYALMAIWSFIYLFAYTNILLLYNITIAAFIFLLFSGLFFKRTLEDSRYKWFIRPCILLFVFDLVSWVCYSFLFVSNKFPLFNSLLTFILTLNCTAIAIILLYNDSPEKLRKRLFYPSLGAIIGGIPSFIILLFLTYLPIQIEILYLFIIAGNISIFLYFISLGIYDWEISKQIWERGAWIWNFIPILNFLLIYQSLTGIDLYTNSLDILGIADISGSILISILICSIIYTPVLYTKIKKSFYKILLTVWGETLFIILWISQNLFGNNIILILISQFFFGTLLLMPILYKLTHWKVVSITWLIVGGFNIAFLMSLFIAIKFILSIAISINIIVTGFFLLVYAYFPNIRHKKRLVTSGYVIFMAGIYFLVYFLFVSITENYYIPINLAFLIIAASLYTSKYLKLNYRYLYTSIYWLIILNTSWLCFNTLILIEGFLWVAISASIACFGILSYGFNRYRFRNPVESWIPWIIFSFGGSLMLSMFFQLFFPESYLLLIGIFVGTAILLLYNILKKAEYAYILWFLIPIPLSCLTLEALLLFELFTPIGILLWMLLYSGYLQLMMLFAGNYGLKFEKEHKYEGLWKLFENKGVYRSTNFICFFLNFTYSSILISFLTPIDFRFQVLEFFMIWAVLILLSMKYYSSAGMEKFLKIRKEVILSVNIFFYFLLSFSFSMLILLFLLASELMVLTLVFYTLFIFFGTFFIEIFLIEKGILRLLPTEVSNRFIFWTWCGLQILLAGFLIFMFIEWAFINLFSIILIMIIETLLSIIFVSFLSMVFPKEIEFKDIKERASPYFLNLLYIEISSCLFGFSSLFLGIFESFLIAHLTLTLLTIIDFKMGQKEEKILSYGIHSYSFICSSLLFLIYLLPLVINNLPILSLLTLFFIILQFYSTFCIANLLIWAQLGEKQEIELKRTKIEQIIGISVYINLVISIYLLLDILNLEIQTIFFGISFSVHILMYIDENFKNYLKKGTQKIKLISWIFILFLSFSYLLIILSILIAIIPLFIIIILAEFYYLLFLVRKVLKWELLEKIKSSLIALFYLDIISWPFYFLIAPSKMIYILTDLGLILGAGALTLLISFIDNQIKAFNADFRNKIQKGSFLFIGFLISLIIFIFLEFLAFPNIVVNFSLFLLIILLFLAVIIKPFEEHSLISLIYWNTIFILVSLIILSLSASLPIAIIIFSFSGLLYLYLFLLEEMKIFFSKFIDYLLQKLRIFKSKLRDFFTIIKRNIIRFYRILADFIHKNFRNIWLINTFSITILTFLFCLFFLKLMWYISLILTVSVFFLLYSVISAEEVESNERAFRKRMMRLIFSWLAVIGIFLYFIDPIFYTILFFVGLLILGAIILPYIYYKEKNNEISIKWRFYSTLFFIIVLIIAGFIIYFQFFM